MTRTEARIEGLMLSAEIARILGISLNTINKMADDGKIQAVKIPYGDGQFWRFYNYDDVKASYRARKPTEKEKLVYEEDQRPYGVKKKIVRKSKYTPMSKRRSPNGTRKPRLPKKKRDIRSVSESDTGI